LLTLSLFHIIMGFWSSVNCKVKASEPAVISGYLSMSIDNRTWQRRWFSVHSDFVLYSFKAHQVLLTSCVSRISLASRTACTMIGYWHDNVCLFVCLENSVSVDFYSGLSSKNYCWVHCLSVCLSVFVCVCLSVKLCIAAKQYILQQKCVWTSE